MKAKEILVIVDDGHGLETAGKRTPKFEDGTFIKENEFNHPTKKIVMDELKDQGFNVFDVSPERTDTSLKTRSDRANAEYKKKKYKAYIYISIHYNAIGYYWEDKVGGIETYHYPTSSKGKKLAEKIHNQLLKGTDLKDRHVKSANFHVLRETAMPAVLLECGFMSNHTEAKLMKNLAYQEECAIEITKGVCDYFGIKYKNTAVDELERLTKIISPKYYPVWLKHFRSNMKLNWVGFMESALRKKYIK
jgi:N-acetylmuramoyl-L-alanine amidase